MTRLFFNPAATGTHPSAAFYGPETVRELRALFGKSPDFTATPMVRLDRVARAMGVGEVWAKDERNRWNQGSFKALGGAYAVVRLAAEALSAEGATAADIFAGAAPPARGLTVAAATAGNHGRAVAFGASLAGARAVIFVYGEVPQAHVAAIAGLGADIVPVAGDYEAACRAAAEACEKNRWTMVSDVASEGYTEIPARIMQGYSVLAAEMLEQAGAPTHIFLQGGVGGLAAAVAAHVAACPPPKPATIVVEAETVPCLMESARGNRLMRTPSTGPTDLKRMDCPTPSTIAWPLLRSLAEGFVGVDNETAAEAVRMLEGEGLPTTPTGAAGLAGLMALARERNAFQRADLSPASRVTIVITEQAEA